MPDNSPPNLELEEWKECRATIARLDELILNIRKFGFTLVTILIGVNGFAYAKLATSGIRYSELTIFLISVALAALMVALFRIDRYHEIFLRATVARAEQIEGNLLTTEEIKGNCLTTEEIKEMALTQRISAYTQLTMPTAPWGIVLFGILLIVNWLLAAAGFASVAAAASPDSPPSADPAAADTAETFRARIEAGLDDFVTILVTPPTIILGIITAGILYYVWRRHRRDVRITKTLGSAVPIQSM